MNFRHTLLLLACALLGSLRQSSAGPSPDWPQWQGPNRDNLCTETGLLQEWPAGRPKLVWKNESVLFGFGAPAVAEGRVFLISNEGLNNEFVQALDAKDGHIVWEFYMVPKGDGDFARGPQAPNPPAETANSWKTADGFPITGGATWTSYTLDPAKGLGRGR